MALNCRPGDLAVTHSAPKDNGIVVRVGCSLGSHSFYGQVWEVTSIGSPFEFNPGQFEPTVGWPDRYLKPLRDDPGTDEMLRIAGLPHDHKQPQEA